MDGIANKLGVEGLFNALDAQNMASKVVDRPVEAEPNRLSSPEPDQAMQTRVDASAITGLGQKLDVEV